LLTTLSVKVLTYYMPA